MGFFLFPFFFPFSFNNKKTDGDFLPLLKPVSFCIFRLKEIKAYLNIGRRFLDKRLTQKYESSNLKILSTNISTCRSILHE